MFLQLTTSSFDLNQLNQFSMGNVLFNVVKIFFLIGFFLYILFAFLVVRQIEEMRRTVVTPLSPIIQVVGYLHLLFSIVAFLFVFIYLS